MVTLNILRDNREQKGWDFDNFDATIEDVTIETGDYTLVDFCDHDESRDTYIPTYAVERKSGDDFLSSITRDMDRFQKEIRRASEWDSPLWVVVEEPKEPSRYQDDFMDFHDISRSQVFKTVDTLENHYNVRFTFAGSRGRAQRLVYDTLQTKLRASLL